MSTCSTVEESSIRWPGRIPDPWRVRRGLFSRNTRYGPAFFPVIHAGVVRPAAIRGLPSATRRLFAHPATSTIGQQQHRPRGVWRCQATRLSRGCLKDSVKTIILQPRLFQSIAACSALQCPTASRPGRPLRCSAGAARRVVGLHTNPEIFSLSWLLCLPGHFGGALEHSWAPAHPRSIL